jgi:hypothetical protein
MNKKIGSGTPKIGQTILIPSGALSARDLEIINGIAKINAPRTYIPRKGETIGDVITARKIDFAEVQKLNPEVKFEVTRGKVHRERKRNVARMRDFTARRGID